MAPYTYNLNGGPFDGGHHTTEDELHPDACVLIPSAGSVGDDGPTWALYAMKGETLEFHGWTDENVEYLQRYIQCTACSDAVMAAMPAGCGFPLECRKCKRHACWPARRPEEGL